MIGRIKKIIELKQINAAQFADEIGVQRSALSHVLSGRNNPSLDFMLKIKQQYPEINLDWLLIGSGNMIENLVTENIKSPMPEKFAFEIEFPDKESEKKEEKKVVQTSKEPEKTVEVAKKIASLSGNKVPKQIIILFEDNSFEIFHSNPKV